MAYKYAEKGIRDNIEGQVGLMESTITNPVAWNEITEKDKFQSQYKQLKKTLIECTPPDLKGAEMDATRARVDQLATAMVLGKSGYVCPMNSQMDQEKCPIGAEGRHIEHDQFWANHTLDAEGNIQRVPKDEFGRALGQNLREELKDKLRAMNKEREEYGDPDLANLEQFRPVHTMGGASLVDSRLPMTFSMPSISHREWVNQHHDFVPPFNAVQAGLYPGFALDGSTIIRTFDHPAFDNLGPVCSQTVAGVKPVVVKASISTDKVERCKGLGKNGPCGMSVKSPDEYCRHHKPKE